MTTKMQFLKAKKFTLMFAFMATLFTHSSNATVVEFQTVFGNFEVNLFDETTPETVANFLSYVNSGAYALNVVHRSVPGFIVQAGGFQYNNVLFEAIPTGSTITNEPELSNVRGTIAMAKLASNENSATSQWFFNLADNSTNLDTQNGGFTVFGQVLGDGMDVIDAIASTTRFNLGGAAAEIPLRNYTLSDLTNEVQITDDNLVIITDIVVTDTAIVTNADLSPTPNTLINSGGGGGGGGDGGGSGDGSSGGGALSSYLIFFLTLIAVFRRIRNK
jgi:peptidyl-prolyl cis-trans isomerase A (cyclophilin A)